jgi:D-xylose transport system permease protein
MTVDSERRLPPDSPSGQQPAGLPGLRALGTAVHWARRRDLSSISIVVALLVIWAMFQSLNNVFLSPDNLSNLSRQISYGGVVSLGLVLVLLIGEVDLSVGSVGGLAAAVLAVLVENHGWNPFLAIAVTVAMGAALGGGQALIFTRFKVPSFVVTLGGLLLFYGLQLKVLGSTGTIRLPFGQTIAQIENKTLSPAVTYSGLVVAIALYGAALLVSRARYRRAQLPAASAVSIALRVVLVGVPLFAAAWVLNRAGGVPLAFVLLLSLVVLFWLITTQTRYGQNIYAVGGNAEAARRAGIGVTSTRIAVFCVCGATAAFGGIMSGSYVGAASQTLGGDTLLLYAIAAAVIGGTSLFGGRGTVWAALLGWLVIGSIYNGMFLLNLESDIQFMIIGGVLIGAVIVDSVSRRARAGRDR